MKKLLFLLISVLFLGSCATIYRDSEGNIVSKEKMEQLKKSCRIWAFRRPTLSHFC